MPGAVAQRLTLAGLLLDEGDRAGAATLGRDVERAARATVRLGWATWRPHWFAQAGARG